MPATASLVRCVFAAVRVWGEVIAAPTGVDADAVPAYGYWQQVWRRFRKDRLAVGSGLFIVFLVVTGFVGGPVASKLLGHGPNDQFAGAVDSKTLLPVGPLTRVPLTSYPGAKSHAGSTLFLLGGDGRSRG